MGRIIKGQIIAGSGPDREGVGILPEAIRDLFEQMEEHGVGGVHHDLSKKPDCRAFNFELEEKPDGHLVISADIEVLDEQAFSQMGGFSISFLGDTYRIGTADPPAVRILMNPRCFNMSSAKSEMAELVPEGYSIEIREKIEKAAIFETAIIILVLSPLIEIAHGFLSAAGADLYAWIKGLVRKDTQEAPIALQLRMETPVITILSLSMDLTPDEFSRIRIPEIQNVLPDGIDPSQIARVIGSINRGPAVNFQFVVLRDGATITLAEDSAPDEEV